MKFLKLIIIVGYLFWGGMLMYAVSELMLRNAWIEIFEIKNVVPSKINFKQISSESIEITYEFETDGKHYIGSRKVINSIADTKLPKQQDEIIVSYNTLVPKVNYLEQLDLKTREGYVGISVSGFFLFFLFLIDQIGDKKKWLERYGMIKNEG